MFFYSLAISAMWCGNAAVQMFPAMVEYRAKNLYSGWTTGSIVTSIYLATESGWFDSDTFHFWFKKRFLPFNLEKRIKKWQKGSRVMNLLKEHFPLLLKRMYCIMLV